MTHPLTICKASAGSGKTFTLAVEYIRRLVSEPAAVLAYREILAVTFTNKATTEMKDRIVEALYAIGHRLPSGDGYLRALQTRLQADGITITDDEIASRCTKALTLILHDYSRFRVETIDAFFQTIMRDLAHELGLASGLQTDINQDEATSEAVDHLLDNIEMDKVLHNLASMFVAHRIDKAATWNITRAIKDFAEHIFDAEYQDNAHLLKPLQQDEHFIANYLKTLHDLVAEKMDYVSSCIDQLEFTMQEAGAAWSVFSNGKDIESHIAYAKTGVLKDFGKRMQGFASDPQNLLRKGDKGDAELQSLSTKVSDLLGWLQKCEAEAREAQSTTDLISRNIYELCFLSKIEEQVRQITARKGIFLLADTQHMLSQLIDGGDTPFIYEKMGAKLSHVMLDEFQDTSTLQWYNFCTLLKDNMDKGGSTLVVGDVKQSIYRWRNGDWRILHTLDTDTEMRRYDPHVVTLDTNYRSHRCVVEFNNRLYGAHDTTNAPNVLGEEVQAVYADVCQHVPHGHEGGYVQLTYAPKVKEASKTKAEQTEDTCREMCEAIAQLHNECGVPYHDMAILIRNNNDEMPIARAFDRFLPSVPLVSNGVFRLAGSVAVQMIIDALRCLYDPTDSPALASLRYTHSRVVLGLTADPNALLLEVAEGPVDALMKDRTRCLRLPLYELVMHIARHFSLYNIEGQSAYLLTFFDKLSAFTSRYTADIGSFLDYADEKIMGATVGGCDIEGVNIITIHKAKGLEWHTVFIPFANWKTERDGELMWCSTHDVAPYNTLPIVPIPLYKKKMEASIFARDSQRESEQQHVDNLNLLYVATTRPSTNLYVWGIEEKGTTAMTVLRQALDGEPWRTIDDDQRERLEYGTLAPYDEKQSSSDNRMHPTFSEIDIDPTGWPILQNFKQSGAAAQFLDSDPDEQQSDKSSYIEQGRLLHAVFEQLRTTADVKLVLDNLRANGVIADDEMYDKICTLVQNGLADSQVATWFAPDAQIYNECTILDADGEHRPDRVIIKGGNITVVDYKFGKSKAEHRTQVERYKHLLTEMYPAAHVEGYLWYVYQKKVEKV